MILDRPLRLVQIAEDIWAVNGTPVDCVYLSMNGLFDCNFDLVVSGANLADDVLYPETISAAFEERLMQQPVIAVSLAGINVRSYQSPKSYELAVKWIHDFVAKGLFESPSRHILNMNIPDVTNLRGVKVTYQGCQSLLKPLTVWLVQKDIKYFGLVYLEKRQS